MDDKTLKEHLTRTQLMQESHAEKLGVLADSIDRYRDDLSDHIQHTASKFQHMDKEMRDLRTEHILLVHEVKAAVNGLERIANQVGIFYKEFKVSRDKQLRMIQLNNTFRDRLLGAVAAVTVIGTLVTIMSNLDSIIKAFS